jgi:hypothetical protein
MAFPAGVKTRNVSFGSAVFMETGELIEMRVTIKASRSLLWLSTGTPVVNLGANFIATDSLEKVFPLPVTDQTGWGDGIGGAISVANGAQTHTYTATVEYYVSGVSRGKVIVGPFALPTGDSTTVDIDKLVPVATDIGPTVMIPQTVAGSTADVPAEVNALMDAPTSGLRTKLAALFMKILGNDIQLPGASGSMGTVNVVDDGTDQTVWPNRLMFNFAGKLTSWFNEYGEFRVAPGKSSTVPMRIFTKDQNLDADHQAGGSIFEIVLSRQTRTNRFRITTEGNVETSGSIQTTGSIAQVIPNGPTLKAGYLVLGAADSIPNNTPANTLIFRI